MVANPIADAERRRTFDEKANNSIWWNDSARNLWMCARFLDAHKKSRLWEFIGLLEKKFYPECGWGWSWVVHMLQAMALECLFKSRWLMQGKGKLAQDGKFRRIPNINQHDLVALARLVWDDVSAEQIDVLARLSKLNAQGRYPVAMHFSDQGCRWGGSDDQVVDQVVQRLKDDFRIPGIRRTVF